ncbi:hypothetical protein PHLCEN_2v2323 [Hermanssonia centrifuga]|uniref:Uncharacterized protein n=1 Tax=Hermanssonia centrifuga TaxID=98765 RepID=A0A2R6RPG5_9APHY|nr:hypothetical protein PHLCEN_2v2323 [Hermanssonia centrifuga]
MQAFRRAGPSINPLSTGPTACESSLIAWTGGQPPFNLTVHSPEVNSPPLQGYAGIASNKFGLFFPPNIAGNIIVVVQDATQASSASDPFILVTPMGRNISCLPAITQPSISSTTSSSLVTTSESPATVSIGTTVSVPSTPTPSAPTLSALTPSALISSALTSTAITSPSALSSDITTTTSAEASSSSQNGTAPNAAFSTKKGSSHPIFVGAVVGMVALALSAAAIL